MENDRFHLQFSGVLPDYMGLADELDRARATTGNTYLRPFARILARLDRGTHGLEPQDIAGIVGCWVGTEVDAWEGAYLVQLADGRRAELGVFADGLVWDGNETLTVDFHPSGFDYAGDDVPTTHPVRLYGWIDRLVEIELYLDLLAGARLSVLAARQLGRDAQPISDRTLCNDVRERRELAAAPSVPLNDNLH
jgi:hypothetical protein